MPVGHPKKQSINNVFSIQFYGSCLTIFVGYRCRCYCLVVFGVLRIFIFIMFRSTLSRGFIRKAPSASIRPFSNSPVMGAAEVKKLGVIGAGQMVGLSFFTDIQL